MESTNVSTHIASHSRRPFQFRLRTLMIVVTLIACASAFGSHWYRTRQRADDAFVEFSRLHYVMFGDSAISMVDRKIQLSRNWCLAECAVPFSDHAGACRMHRDFVESELHTGFGSDNDKLKEYRLEAEQWLAAGTASGEPTELTYPKPE